MRLAAALLKAIQAKPGNVIDLLRRRGLVENVTKAAADAFSDRGGVVYVGFDPTADSLHVGNLISIMSLLHFQRCGHQPIAVVGGATGMIGDPSGRASERTGLARSALEQNVQGIRSVLEQVFSHAAAAAVPGCSDELPRPLLLNNADWYRGMSVLDFFTNVGSFFRLSSMLGKESVLHRVSSEEGMSFQEFSYQVFQSYDYLHLHRNHDCALQIGGGDQWGNITAGCEFVRKVTTAEVHGLTVPLLTTSTGEKIGKSAGNAIWLSAQKTSCYKLYQYFVKTADDDVERYLKTFTFLPLDEIDFLMEQHHKCPEDRGAQKKLAECVTRNVHGENGLCQAVNATSALFGSPAALRQLERNELEQLLADAPTFAVSLQDVGSDSTVLSVLNQAGVLPSKGHGKRLVEGGGLYVNHEKVTSTNQVLRKDIDIILGNLTVVRTGKSNYFILKWS